MLKKIFQTKNKFNVLWKASLTTFSVLFVKNRTVPSNLFLFRDLFAFFFFRASGMAGLKGEVIVSSQNQFSNFPSKTKRILQSNCAIGSISAICSSPVFGPPEKELRGNFSSGVSAGSFPEQRLVVEPSCAKAIDNKLSSQYIFFVQKVMHFNNVIFRIPLHNYNDSVEKLKVNIFQMLYSSDSSSGRFKIYSF